MKLVSILDIFVINIYKSVLRVSFKKMFVLRVCIIVYARNLVTELRNLLENFTNIYTNLIVKNRGNCLLSG